VLNGIHCAACIWLLEKLPQLVNGVAEARVNWNRSTVEVAWIPEATSLSEIALTLNRLGHGARPSAKRSAASRRDSGEWRQLVNLGVAAALAGNNMLFGGALISGCFRSWEVGSKRFSVERVACLGFLSVLGPGRVSCEPPGRPFEHKLPTSISP
jgi:Cu2+-exporting ATPase